MLPRLNGGSKLQFVWLATLLVFLNSWASESAPLRPKLTQIEPDCGVLGPNWDDEYGMKIDNLSDLRGLSSNEQRVAEILREQLLPLGIVGVADYSCIKQEAPLDTATVRVFVFENSTLAFTWWGKKYQYEGWENHYTRPADARHEILDSTQIAKRVVITSNLWVTSHHIQSGTEHLVLLNNILSLLGVD